jgi:MOSC domain-containing protein YiiM
MPQVLQVSRSELHGFSKTSQPHIRVIAGEGVECDAHRGRTVQHLYLVRKDPTQPNLCQVHLLAAEKLEALAEQGFPVQPGELGENILTHGLDLLTLPTATLLHIGPEAILEVTGLRTPCSQIDAFRAGLQQHMWGERGLDDKRPRDAGIMSIVRTGGLIHPNDPIRIELPPQPHIPLGPV